jgi:thymidylate kinase
MITVALIGPDGAGKTTIGRRLEHTLPIPVKYLYMGFVANSGNVMLPTTRLVYAVKRMLGGKLDVAMPFKSNETRSQPLGFVKRNMARLRSSLRLINWLSEEWFRYLLAYYYQRRGYVVLCDRHFFFDHYAYNVLNQRIHRFLLERVYPRPDLVIYFDAPAEVLFARKGEETIEALERRRQNYLQLCHLVKHFVTVDTTQSEDETARDVADQILDFYEAKVGKR